MHLTDSLMAAFEATNDSTYLRMAERIADLIVGRHAVASVFEGALRPSSAGLMEQTQRGILLYDGLGWQSAGPRPLLVAVLRGVAVSAVLNAIEGDPPFEQWYRRIWNFIATRFIDREIRGWRAQIADMLRQNRRRSLAKSISTML
jgi:mannose/cellobiose epimerase-like protein (N-acyl-D-glucosamine 2-epimerase family)